jgi:hypothetical protein
VARSSSLSFIASAKIRSTFVIDTHYTTASGRVPTVSEWRRFPGFWWREAGRSRGQRPA